MDHCNLKAFGETSEVRDIVRYQRIGPSIDGCLENHLVIRIASKRPPLKMEFCRLDQCSHLRQEFVDGFERQSVS